MNKLIRNNEIKFLVQENESDIFNNLDKLKENNIVERIWQKDFTVWSNKPDEVSNRLGWLDCNQIPSSFLTEINSFVDDIKNEGFENIVIMGMGGSSLAPEVFSRTFFKPKFNIYVLDSTHPDVINNIEQKVSPENTLYIISTKSGGTIETISLMKYFFTRAAKKLGNEKVKNHFAFITDPGSGLEAIGKKLGVRKIFINDPNIGGRFSALSLFGLVPAAFAGVDLFKLMIELNNVVKEAQSIDLDKNSSAQLGAVIGTLANKGIDKLTFFISPKLPSFGAWIEQLIAESTGKNGKGILPIDGEPLDKINRYTKDRVFIYIKLENESFLEDEFNEIENADFPAIKIILKDIYDIGKEFFRWEFATAIAGYFMGIQPYDQPNVESAKIVAREMIAKYVETKVEPQNNPNFAGSSFDINSSEGYSKLKSEFQFNKNDCEYIAIQAFINPSSVSEDTITELKISLQKKYHLPLTFGIGPRFLHSTGQLHKGDKGKGLFIQLIEENSGDLMIPEEPLADCYSYSFGVLVKAQGLGDRKALLDAGRKVITIDLGLKPEESLQKVIGILN
ncbi:MAG: hypothetical protein M0P71_00145 [Melioribacteraceae bacterium]|nr:hypothetical protein [Melioribacteraceae bacterium]